MKHICKLSSILNELISQEYKIIYCNIKNPSKSVQKFKSLEMPLQFLHSEEAKKIIHFLFNEDKAFASLKNKIHRDLMHLTLGMKI